MEMEVKERKNKRKYENQRNQKNIILEWKKTREIVKKIIEIRGNERNFEESQFKQKKMRQILWIINWNGSKRDSF